VSVIRQPRWPQSGARLDRAHPLACGLQAAVQFTTEVTAVNDVTGRPFGTLGPIVTTRAASPLGSAIGAPLTAATTPGVTVSPAIVWPASTAGTILLHVQFRASDSFGVILAQAATRGFYFRNTGGLRLFPADTTATGHMAAGEWATIGVTRAADGTVRYFKNGLFLEASVTTTTLEFAFDGMFNDSASETAAIDITYLYVWNRVLTDAEIAALFVDPFAFYQPVRVRAHRVPPFAAGTAFPWHYYAQQLGA
jgi:hypothetical protein